METQHWFYQAVVQVEDKPLYIDEEILTVLEIRGNDADHPDDTIRDDGQKSQDDE